MYHYDIDFSTDSGGYLVHSGLVSSHDFESFKLSSLSKSFESEHTLSDNESEEIDGDVSSPTTSIRDWNEEFQKINGEKKILCRNFLL